LFESSVEPDGRQAVELDSAYTSPTVELTSRGRLAL
jgi:hypothetical protein